MKTKQVDKTADVIIIIAFMLLSFWIGYAMSNDMPEYKAHVKGDNITVEAIK
jgi:hypothetical protein